MSKVTWFQRVRFRLALRIMPVDVVYILENPVKTWWLTREEAIQRVALEKLELMNRIVELQIENERLREICDPIPTH